MWWLCSRRRPSARCPRGRFIEVRRTLRDGQEDRRVALPKNGRIRRVDLSGQLVEELPPSPRGAQPGSSGQRTGRAAVGLRIERGTAAVQGQLRSAGLSSAAQEDRPAPGTLPRPSAQFASRLLQNGESPAYVKDHGHLIPGPNKAAVDRLDTTGRNPRATAREPRGNDVAVSGRVNWLPGLGSNQRLPD